MTAYQFIPIAISIIAAIISGCTLLFNKKTIESKEILQEAILLLSRAFSTLTNNEEDSIPVKPDRINWLSCARQLEEYKLLKEKISNKSHKIVCTAQEEYWRHKFYLLFKEDEKYPIGYFEENPVRNRHESIEPISALIVFDFSSWPSEKKDPIDNTDYLKILKENPTIIRKNRGLKQYLSKFRKFKID